MAIPSSEHRVARMRARPAARTEAAVWPRMPRTVDRAASPTHSERVSSSSNVTAQDATTQPFGPPARSLHKRMFYNGDMRWDNLLSGPEGEETETTRLPLFPGEAIVRSFKTPQFRGMTFYEVAAKSI